MAKTTYFLYGSKTLDIKTVADLLSTILKCSFVPHESSDWGEYERLDDGDNHAKVLTNFKDEQGEILEADYLEYQTFVRIHGPLALEHEADIQKIKGLEQLQKRESE